MMKHRLNILLEYVGAGLIALILLLVVGPLYLYGLAVRNPRWALITIALLIALAAITVR